MAKNATYSASLLNAQADLLARRLDNGYLRFYTDTQPASPDTAITSQTLLAELRFAATSAPAAVDGVLTFNDIAAVAAVGTGTATWFRALRADGTTAELDGSIGTADANLVLNSASLQTGAEVAITDGSFTHTIESADAA